jgi:dephospho-CoA kinase
VFIVGLTGGIGAGKTTVARMLAERGAHVIDVDALGRRVLEADGRAYKDVVDAFGPQILDDSGRIDRAALARIVFADPGALARLTSISHPAINAELVELLDALPDETLVVLDMAVLAESNLGRPDPGHSYRFVVTVEAPAETRVERAVERGFDASDARRRMGSQATDDQRRALSDVVIVNDGDLEALAAKVDELWKTLRSMESAR